MLSLSSSTVECFKFLDTVFRGIAYNSKRHMWSFVPQISDLKMTFSKLSLAKYHYLQKTAFTINSVHNFSYLHYGLINLLKVYTNLPEGKLGILKNSSTIFKDNFRWNKNVPSLFERLLQPIKIEQKYPLSQNARQRRI